MSLDRGTRVKGRNHTYEIIRNLGVVGGESEGLYECRAVGGAPARLVLKVIHPSRRSPARYRRLEWLVEQALWRASPAILAPRDLVLDGILGHVTELAPGETLERWWTRWESGETCWTFLDGIGIALAVTKALARLEALGLSHGDIQVGNIILARHPTHWEVFLIDLDNFIKAGLPNPEMAGAHLYIAPELRTPGAGPLTPAAVRYSLYVLLHEILFLSDPYPDDRAAQERMERSGTWNLDPTRPRAAGTGGYPPDAVDPALRALFRRGASAIPGERPSAAEWATALDAAFTNVYACDHPDCTQPFVIDSGKTCCPHCHRPHPPVELSWKGGKRVSDVGVFRLGRAELGDAPGVSKYHAVVRRHGPEVRIEDLGSANGTFRWDGKTFRRLPPRCEIALRRGDRLKLAEVEVAAQ